MVGINLAFHSLKTHDAMEGVVGGIASVVEASPTPPASSMTESSLLLAGECS